MNKKGFTLIEVLIVIVILSAVSVSSIIIFDKIDEDTTQNNKEDIYKSIQRSAITYLDMVNGGLEELTSRREVYINLYTLIDNNYVSNKIKDPLTGGKLPNNYLVKVFIAKDEFNNDYLSSCILDKTKIGNQCIANRDGVLKNDCCAACVNEASQINNDGTIVCN